MPAAEVVPPPPSPTPSPRSRRRELSRAAEPEPDGSGLRAGALRARAGGRASRSHAPARARGPGLDGRSRSPTRSARRASSTPTRSPKPAATRRRAADPDDLDIAWPDAAKRGEPLPGRPVRAHPARSRRPRRSRPPATLPDNEPARPLPPHAAQAPPRPPPARRSDAAGRRPAGPHPARRRGSAARRAGGDRRRRRGPLWLAQRLLPAVQRRGRRPRHRARPGRLDRRRGRRHPRREGRRRLRLRLHAARAPPGGAATCAQAGTYAQAGLVATATRSTRSRPGRRRADPVVKVTIPEGRSRREAAPLVEQAGLEGSYLDGVGEAAGDFNPRRYGAPRGVRASRASCSRRRTSSSRARVAPRSSPSSSTPSARTSARSTCAARRARNLDAYDVLDHRLDGRARGAARQGAPADLRGHPQPPARGHAARHRRDDPLRDAQLEPAAASSPSCNDRLALQHAPPHRPAARRRSAARAWPRSRPRPTRRNVDYLYYVVKPGTCGEHNFSSTRRRVPAATSRRTTARARRAAASRRRPAERASRGASASSAGRSRTAARPRSTTPRYARSASTAGATSGCRCRRSSSTRRSRALPAAGFHGANVTIPHKEAALALADDGDRRRRARSAPPTRSRSADGAIHADNTDAPGFLAAIGDAPRDRARARRRRLGARGRLGAAQRRRRGERLEPDPRAGAGARRPSVVEPGRRRRPRTCSSTARRVGLGDRQDVQGSRCDPMHRRVRDASSTWSTGRRHGARLARARAQGARTVDGLEILVRQGALSLRAVDRPGGAARRHAASRTGPRTKQLSSDADLRAAVGPRSMHLHRSPTRRAPPQWDGITPPTPAAAAQPLADRRPRRARLRRPPSASSRPSSTARAARHDARAASCSRGHDHARTQLARAHRRAPRPRPPRPVAVPGRHGRRQPPRPPPPPSATRPSRSPTSTSARCSSRWPTRPTSSAIDDIAIMTGLEVRAAVASREDIAGAHQPHRPASTTSSPTRPRRGRASTSRPRRGRRPARVRRRRAGHQARQPDHRPGGRAGRLRHPPRARGRRAARPLPHRRRAHRDDPIPRGWSPASSAA